MKESAALAVKRIFLQLEQAAAAEAEAEAEAAAAAAADGGASTSRKQEQQQQQQQQQGAADGGMQQQDVQQPPPQQLQRLGAGALSAAELAGLAITMADFEAAVPKVQPSVRREGFATTPDVTWDDVGSLGDVREELAFAITQPIAHPEVFEAMGLTAATGVLLFGPPGNAVAASVAPAAPACSPSLC